MNTRMLRPLLFLLLTPMAFSTLHAQDDDTEQPAISADRLQQIKAQKSAFITQRLSLTAEEARTFWPIYDKYDTEIAAVRKEMRSDRRNRKSSGTLTDAEASKAIDANLQNKQDQLDIRKRYVTEFKKSIGALKTLQLEGAERDFNRELLKQIQNRKR
ncbi:MAG: hypothetical protein IPO60_07315 [Flavobacteriales bacterium]|nr:hypothetical protein [Flavobacteriales bacterium]MBK6894370.1 hypothetical protein [Flavobacteriales bacterium]MBK7248298.1 hypothetical protein [Flavobacteriales bacterium]MBK7287000.1 hypothetical protein [Flavobacteriales bacterium]MBK9059503.1 hypothetical protein [Flavobacteriales bacterium]